MIIKDIRDFWETTISSAEVVGKRVIKGGLNKLKNPTHNKLPNGETDYYSELNHYTKRMYDILSSKNDENISHYIERLYESYLHRLDNLNRVGYLNSELHQQQIFDNILIFLNNLYRNPQFKYLYNSLSKNDMDEFSKLKIGNQINDFIGKKGNNADGINTGGCCIHYTLILNHFFSELENHGLKMTHKIFVERTHGIIHTGIKIAFQNKNYVVDSSGFNGKLIQPISELRGEGKDRMEKLTMLQCSTDPVDDFNIDRRDYHKIIIQKESDLFDVLRGSYQSPSFIISMPRGMSENVIN